MEGDLRWCCGSSNNNNWDLHAVVRFACGGGGRVTPPPASDESFSWLPLPQPQKHETIEAGAPQPLPADAAAVDDLCLEAALFAVTKPDTPLSASSLRNQAPPQLEPPSKPRTSYRNGGGPTRSKRKKKKCQVSKDVTRVAAGAPSPDLWAWRKYGQKPIKGSPYPRGYYRCSTDKNCKARKQVERCRDDPATLIVSYTGEHSHPVPLHRNSLAGTTRKKPQPPPSACPGGEPPQPQAAPTDDTKRQGSPSASAGLSPATPVLCPPVGVGHEEEDEEEAVTASMRLEDVEMEGEDDVLLFLEPALGLGSCGSGCEDAMLFRPEPSEPAPGQGNGVGWEDVMLFSKLYEPAPTTSRS